MLTPPRFWWRSEPGLAARLLRGFEPLTARATAVRLRRPGWRAPVPVFCCGNVVVGGAGKTTLAIDLLRRLRARGINAHALIRGYGGRGGEDGPIRVEPGRHDATMVGDEALLLAAEASCWVGADRAASARAAVVAGAEALVMDDGLQNPGLIQDCAILVMDGAVGVGNGRLLPAGPLREPLAGALRRVAAVTVIGADRTGIGAILPAGMPRLDATVAMDPALGTLRGEALLAFAGIGRPAKFFEALDGIGLRVVARRGFPDHHRFRPRELDALRAEAGRLGARLITTPKDAVRLPDGFRTSVVVAQPTLCWADPAGIEALLDRALSRKIRPEWDAGG